MSEFKMNEWKSSEPVVAPSYEYDHTSCLWDIRERQLQKMKMPEGVGWELVSVHPFGEAGQGIHYVWRRVIG